MYCVCVYPPHGPLSPAAVMMVASLGTMGIDTAYHAIEACMFAVGTKTGYHRDRSYSCHEDRRWLP